ncbi:Thioredoxin-like protein [Trema orientale]|uniref:Thioredoxin-like protein n=1 Tax=Trema orientale TaxID=63057 RepID=A0A2P5FA90_TREOI|nr:Thioredoxin-like protein [Trema orientale]
MESHAEKPLNEAPKSESVNRVMKLVHRRMLVGIKDGRFFLGNFHCMDKQGNIILQDSVEYRSTRRSTPSPMEQRCLVRKSLPSLMDHKGNPVNDLAVILEYVNEMWKEDGFLCLLTEDAYERTLARF